jgi:hypothetical protein
VIEVRVKEKKEGAQTHEDDSRGEVDMLNHLTGVEGGRMIIGGPSLMDHLERSREFQVVLVSHNERLATLQEYHTTREHDQYV